MAVGLAGLPSLHAVSGVRLGTAEAAVKKPGRHDLLVVELARGSTCAAVFTRNAFCAAPVTVARDHLCRGAPRLWLVNSGNANAGTGAQGLDDARSCCSDLAALTGCASHQVLPFSTGVIGAALPVERIRAALPRALDALAETGWEAAAGAIMTTDTVPKGASRQVEVGGRRLTVTGVAKGAGMIRPDMATMLAFVATDARVPRDVLQQCLAEVVEQSFNRITVDGDTSTNDACVLGATGAGSLAVGAASGPAYQALRHTVGEVCLTLAQAIVRDGEGATRFVAVTVEGGASRAECDAVAYSIAHSPLVKTALFAGDPNWGRILAAVGRAGLPHLDVDGVHIFLDEVCIVRGGEPDPGYREAHGARVLAQPEYTIRVVLGRGIAASTIWTCDLSYDYVRINAEYRT